MEVCSFNTSDIRVLNYSRRFVSQRVGILVACSSPGTSSKNSTFLGAATLGWKELAVTYAFLSCLLPSYSEFVNG